MRRIGNVGKIASQFKWFQIRIDLEPVLRDLELVLGRQKTYFIVFSGAVKRRKGKCEMLNLFKNTVAAVMLAGLGWRGLGGRESA